MHSVVACLLLLAILTVAGAPASAHPESGTGMMGGGMMGREMIGGMDRAPGHEGPLISLMLGMKDQLGLTLQQVKSLRDLRTAFEKEVIQRGAEIRVAELELRETLAQDQVDLAGAEALVRKIAGLRADLRLSRLRTLERGKGLLTPEQLQKFREAARWPAAGCVAAV